MSRRIAFLGLGKMGLPMASNLAKAHAVTCFDPTAAALADAASAGLASATSASEAAAGADTVVSMLPTGKHAADVYLGEGGLLKALGKGALALDCSTIDAPTARRIGEAAAAEGVLYLDTPVSGGTAAAAAGSLAFMCGGSADGFAQARPVLEAMGKREGIFHAGPAGSGQVAKACNNMLLAIHMIGTSEALEMGARSGLDPTKLSEIMNASSGRNWSLDVYNPYEGVMPAAPASKGYAPGFAVDLMLKDLGLAQDVAAVAGLETPLGALAHQLYSAHQAAGNGGRDFSSIIQALRDRSPA